MSWPSDPQVILHALIYVIALVLSVSVHEFGHAWVADALGDRVARSQGRVTLNPLAHADPIGTILFPLIGALTGARVLGWGKPVFHSLSARHLPRHITLRTGQLFISVAGPFMNLAFAAVLSILFIVLARAHQPGLAELVAYVISMNIGLAYFNLIPVPPLDGRSILFWFLPSRNPIEEFLERYGMFFLFILIWWKPAMQFLFTPARIAIEFWMRQLHALAY
jgi:Zn-dependent protease